MEGQFGNDLLKEVQETRKRTEYRKIITPDGSSFDLKPTYRAALAEKGYLVRQTVGAGTYSKVKYGFYVSSSGAITQQVAVKIVDREKGPKDYLEKFLPRELQIWPKIAHSHLVRLYKCFENCGKIFMITEWVEGGDLLTYVQKKGAVDEKQTRIWFFQILDAVRYMHGNNITHRDLKLENLLIRKDGKLKICDFGFVRTVSGDQMSKTYCGSKSYAPPEILMGKQHDPMKVDIWALGVVVYIMVTGKMPFDESKGNKAIVEAQKAMRLYWPSAHPVTKECKALIFKCMTFDFKLRPNIHQVIDSEWLSERQEARLERPIPGAPVQHRRSHSSSTRSRSQ